MGDLFASMPQTPPNVDDSGSSRFLVHNADQFVIQDEPLPTEPAAKATTGSPWSMHSASGDTTQLFFSEDSSALEGSIQEGDAKAAASKSYTETANATLKWIKRKTGSDPDASSLLAKEPPCATHGGASQKIVC